jgi:hypothetical protein
VVDAIFNKCLGPCRVVAKFNAVFLFISYTFTHRIAIHESPVTISPRIAIKLRAVGEVVHIATGVSDSSRTGKHHEGNIGDHRYQESQQCAFRDGSRGVL